MIVCMSLNENPVLWIMGFFTLCKIEIRDSKMCQSSNAVIEQK